PFSCAEVGTGPSPELLHLLTPDFLSSRIPSRRTVRRRTRGSASLLTLTLTLTLKSRSRRPIGKTIEGHATHEEGISGQDPSWRDSGNHSSRRQRDRSRPFL